MPFFTVNLLCIFTFALASNRSKQILFCLTYKEINIKAGNLAQKCTHTTRHQKSKLQDEKKVKLP